MKEENLIQPVPDTAVADNLRRTKGWLVFIGVMTIIGAGLGLIFSLLGLLGALGAGTASRFADQGWPPPGFGPEYLTTIAVMFFFGIVCSAILLWAAIMLFQAASHADIIAADSGALIGYTDKLRRYFLLIGVNMIIGAANALFVVIMVFAMLGKVGSGFVP